MDRILTISYWIVFFSLVAGIVIGLLVATHYYLRDRVDKRADWLFGSLLATFALTLLHNLLIHRDLTLEYPQLLFLPVYFTLSFGPLLFFFVKIKLFPSYKIRWTDGKHLLLPVGQLIYFLFFFVQPAEVKEAINRQFWSPFYGGLEMLLYITTFSAYQFFAYRYIRYKKAAVRKSPGSKEAMVVAWLKRMVKALFLLFVLNTSYILTDFFTYELLGINLHLLKGFDYIGSISFAAMLLWLAINGWFMRHL